MSKNEQNPRVVKMSRLNDYRRFLALSFALVIAGLLLWLIMRPGYSVGSFYEATESSVEQVDLADNPFLAPADKDLSISKTHSGDFQIGTSGNYSILITNIGSEAITGTITVTDDVPLGLTPSLVTGTGWSPCNFVGQLVTCVYSNTAGLPSLVALPPIILTVNTSSSAAPQVTNSATVANINDGDNTNDTATDPTTIVSADLSVTKAVSPSVPDEGDPIAYTLSVKNNGPNDTTGAGLIDVMPAGVTFASAIPSKGTYNPANGVWSIGNLANNETVTLTINATVNAGTRGTTIVNDTDGLTSDLFDYNTANNTASASFLVSSTRLIGLVTDAVTDQPIVSSTVIITDSVSHVYTTQTSASGWYTFTDSISTPLAPGAASVKASKTGYRSKTTSTNILVDAENRLDFSLDTADLVAKKTDGKTTVIPGSTITYTLTISNVGTIAADQVVITDVMPSYLTYVEDTSDIDHDIPKTGTIVWELPDDLAPNAKFTYQVQAKVANALPSPTEKVINTISTSTSSPEANLANNTAKDENTATGTPNVSISLSVSPSQASSLQSVVYKITVSNKGTAPVTDVVVEDTFSSFLSLTSVNTTKGTATTNTTTRFVTVKTDVLKPDETMTITVIGRVNTTATSNRTVSNSAEVSYKFGGSTTSKDSNSASFLLLVSSTLPSTGGVEIFADQTSVDSMAYLLAFASAALLGLAGLAALVYSLKIRAKDSDWSSWYRKMGVLLLGAALIFGSASYGLRQFGVQSASHDLNTIAKSDYSNKVVAQESSVEVNQPYSLPVYDEPESLPDYPIPAPTAQLENQQSEEELDLTPVERIVIPSLGLDTIVKYVPFDGLSWMIAGLKQEIAWMGDTSWPGLGGNVGLAGHVTLRDGSNGPFRNLEQLGFADLISLYTQENIYTYLVREKQVVDDTDLSVVEASENPLVTLITCTGWDAELGLYRKRLVVFAELVEINPIKDRELSIK